MEMDGHSGASPGGRSGVRGFMLSCFARRGNHRSSSSVMVVRGTTIAFLLAKGKYGPLEEAMEPAAPLVREEDNAFDVLRLILALLVVQTHASLIGGFKGPDFLGVLTKNQMSGGTLGVLGFFGISGFLVTRSYVARGAVRAFVSSRLLRILPALYFALFLAAFVIAPILAHLNPQAGPWHLSEALGYLSGNLAVKHKAWNVGSVLSGMPYSGSLNGALWSLFPEVLCYGVVLVLGLLGCFSARRWSVVLLGAMTLVIHLVLVMQPETQDLTLVPTFLRLTGMAPFVASFLVGSSLYLYRKEAGLGGPGALLWCVIAAVLLKFGGWRLFAPVVLPMALLNTAYAFTLRLPLDLSYGIYVLHFPTQQLLAAFTLQRVGEMPFFLLSAALTAVLACVSWFCIERPALALKGRW